jgi:two-component system CheB/CheR fusion protein
VYLSVQRQSAIETRGLKVSVDNKVETINIQVRPVFRESDVAHGFFLVIFEPSTEETPKNEVLVTSDQPVARHLEEELMRVKVQLRSSIEHHEFQAEELKASNEELQAMNEELRSAAEELETSKEELQSINEELRTVNQELKIKVEETVLASNNLQNLINSVDIATIFLDRSFRVALFTPPARNLFNLIPNDLGRELSDITHKLEQTDIIRDVELVIEKLNFVEREVRTLEGKLYMMRVLPYRTQEDRINGVVITFFDITDRKLSEEALRKSEERFRIALKSADMAAWDLNVLDKTTIWNEQHYTILGLIPVESPRPEDYFMQFIHPDDVAMVSHALKMTTEELIPYQAEFRIIRDDNKETRWMSGYGRVVAQAEGRATRIVGVMYDITHRKELEKQKDDFIGIASHELKTPVTSIKAYAQILQGIFKDSGDTRSADFMKRLDVQVSRLTDLIKALLDTTKISEGQLPLHPERFDVNILIAEHIADLQPISKKHPILFTPAAPAFITADRERVGQVLTNLISNAVKYSPDGGDVLINLTLMPDKIKVSVQDSGIGIPREMIDKVFGRFFRVKDPHAMEFPGMGLGLYITAGIVQRHGGVMNVESVPGQGSVFSFTLPVLSNGY